jgi:GT2 family glycosyltransferase
VSQCEVVIVNFNAGEFLKDAVQSVLLSRAVAHVCVVDNASSDASLGLLPLDHNDRLTIIRNQANLGFATASNIGLARATADYVLLLNPDCRVAEGAIERLIAALQSTEDAGMAGPLLLNSDGSEQAAGRRKFPMPRTVLAHTLGAMWFKKRVLGLGAKRSEDAPPKQSSEIEAISGACMMASRTAIADVGPLDEHYFLHCEDLDWCMRFHLRGWKVLFVPEANVVHHKGISSRQRPLAAEYHKHKGMVRFYRKFLGGTHPRWLLMIVALSVWTRFTAVAARRLRPGWSERR